MMSITKENIYKAGEKYVGYKSGQYTTEQLQSINDFKAGAEWMAGRSFTLEDIDNLFLGMNGYFDDFLDYRLGLYGGVPKNDISFKDWFEKFKKK
jgi:hypothetical protein